MGILEAKHYKEEELTLMLDPIIQMMFAEIPEDEVLDYNSWDFISAASDEYHERGGKLAKSIGGPARAIKALRNG